MAWHEPAVMTARGPCRSEIRPTGIPTAAETSSAAEKSAAVAGMEKPVSAAMRGASTGKT
ncbi:hypothetical protein [Streptomyces sp. NBC_01537]|uniref:hypothetical protein n=1 Tax=Streptomyces sp. NBC_01537 TaxID=2903896 RepID=UPI00386548F3